MNRWTIPKLKKTQSKNKKLVMLTAYDYWTAKLVDAHAHLILVGDSLGMVFQGKDNTLGVTLDQMIYHAQAVVRGRSEAMVIGDMPYMTYHISVEETLRNAGRLIQEAGVDAVKLEGGKIRAQVINALVQAQIPVMGHIGLTPQSVNAFGGFKVQGLHPKQQEALIDDALAVQDAGAFSVVLEGIPFDLAEQITEKLEIPTIGIGAGPHCSGQVLVTQDLLGMSFMDSPKFVRRFADVNNMASSAIQDFARETQEGTFPTLEESYRSRTLKVVNKS